MKDDFLASFPDGGDFALIRARYPLTKLGMGARRICFSIGESGYCVKFLRTQADRPDRLLGWRAKRMLKKYRFDLKRNINCLEADAMRRYRDLAGARVASALPEIVKIVRDEERGYGIMMDELRNADESGVKSVIKEMMERPQDVDFQKRAFAAMDELIDDLIAVSAPFYEVDNFVVQYATDGSWRLRIIDFEPVGKKLFSPERYWPWYRRLFIRRKRRQVFTRYLERLAGMRAKNMV